MKATAPHRPVIVVPTYNTGHKVLEVVQELALTGHEIIVINDGSTDGTGAELADWARAHPNSELLTHPENHGKGQAVLTAAARARDRGFTHMLTFDADGQHPCAMVDAFLDRSRQNPGALVAGHPVFDASAPWERMFFRRWANFWTRLLGHTRGLADSMFGMRVYPVGPLLDTMAMTRAGRRYDFECVTAILLGWLGLPVANIPVPVAYFDKREGGISHYRYCRDNIRLGLVFLRHIPGAIARFPSRRAARSSQHPATR